MFIAYILSWNALTIYFGNVEQASKQNLLICKAKQIRFPLNSDEYFLVAGRAGCYISSLHCKSTKIKNQLTILLQCIA